MVAGGTCMGSRSAMEVPHLPSRAPQGFGGLGWQAPRNLGRACYLSGTETSFARGSRNERLAWVWVHNVPMGKRMLTVILSAVALAAGIGFMVARWQSEKHVQRQSHSLAEAVRRVTKLATVEVNVSNWQLRTDSKELFGFLPFRCEKTVAVFYRGKVAAGFELAPEAAVGLRIRVAHPTRKVQVRLPAPRILYTDVPPPELVVADGSICNRLTPEDYKRLHIEARTAVERDAINTGLLARAESHAHALLTEVARPLGYDVELLIDYGEMDVAARQ